MPRHWSSKDRPTACASSTTPDLEPVLYQPAPIALTPGDRPSLCVLKPKVPRPGARVPYTRFMSARGRRFRPGADSANGARLRLASEKDWAVNDPATVAKVLKVLEEIQNSFNKAHTGGKEVSLADMIVLGGAAAIEKAASAAGNSVTVPFKPGRTDATQAQTRRPMSSHSPCWNRRQMASATTTARRLCSHPPMRWSTVPMC